MEIENAIREYMTAVFTGIIVAVLFFTKSIELFAFTIFIGAIAYIIIIWFIDKLFPTKKK
jgi:hypothetical protein